MKTSGVRCVLFLGPLDDERHAQTLLQDGRHVGSPPENNLAIMAFTLTDLPTDLTRRQMLRELWDTGADTMVGARFLHSLLTNFRSPNRTSDYH